MTTEILNKKEENEIDWDVPQWVVGLKNGVIIFTNGEHENDSFSGQSLPCEDSPNGYKKDGWGKRFFKPIPKEGLQILIKN